jgi:hypothetical protein
MVAPSREEPSTVQPVAGLRGRRLCFDGGKVPLSGQNRPFDLSQTTTQTVCFSLDGHGIDAQQTADLGAQAFVLLLEVSLPASNRRLDPELPVRRGGRPRGVGSPSIWRYPPRRRNRPPRRDTELIRHDTNPRPR